MFVLMVVHWSVNGVDMGSRGAGGQLVTGNLCNTKYTMSVTRFKNIQEHLLL